MPRLLPQRLTKGWRAAGCLRGGRGRVPPPRGRGGRSTGQGAPSPRGERGPSACLGEARAAFHPGVGTWCPDRRPCVGPVSQYKGDRAARREGARGREERLFSSAPGGWAFLTRCRLYSQQINNFLSRQQCRPVCVCACVPGSPRCPPRRAPPPLLLCTEGLQHGGSPVLAPSRAPSSCV